MLGCSAERSENVQSSVSFAPAWSVKVENTFNEIRTKIEVQTHFGLNGNLIGAEKPRKYKSMLRKSLPRGSNEIPFGYALFSA